MIKKIIMCLCLLLLCSCSKEKNVETIAYTKDNVAIGITYPVTGISKLDKQTKKYVDEEYSNFKNHYENIPDSQDSELNIDYQYEQVDDYTSVILHTFINSPFLAHPITKMKTFVYYNGKIINFSDLVKKETLKEIIPFIKQELLKNYKECILMEEMESQVTDNFLNYEKFTISKDGLVLYFNPYIVTSGYCGIIHITIPFDKIGLKASIPNKAVKYVDKTNNKTIDPNKKMVALTFDDGPSKYTNLILDLLEQYQSNATFFVLGNKVKMYQETINRSIAMGNEIGNHSYNHKWLTRLNTDEFKEQVEKTQNILKEMNNYTPTLLRPTYGSINKRIRSNTALKIIMWTVDSSDWKIKNSKRISERVLNDIEDMDIVLFHDIHQRTYEALKVVIPTLIEQGYQLVTVSELKEVQLLRQKIK